MDVGRLPRRAKRWWRREKTVIVLGMHRSGTSMVSSMLQELGVHMGEDMVPANSGNPLGHFEDIDFLAVNEDILEEAGGDWLDPPSRHRIVNVDGDATERVQRFVWGRNGRPVWGWKDPRNSLTVEHYLGRVTNPHLVVCVRSPSAVVASIIDRGDADSERYILSVIEEYRLRIDFVRATYQLPTIVIDYDAAIRHPWWTCVRVRSFLGRSPGMRSPAAAARVVRGEQRHHD